MEIEDFIIWDKLNNQFLDCDLVNGIVFCNGKFSYVSRRGAIHNDLFAEEVEFFSYVGIDDIDMQRVYADCSIVEFEWGQNKHNIIGYFTYNKEYLCYEIIMINAQKGKSMCYAPHNCFNIKIIDTIQENKLGLIK